MTTAIRFSLLTIDERSQANAPLLATPEYKAYHLSFVETHLSLFPWPNETVHRLLQAEIAATGEPAAFCYYYGDQDAEHCYLFGVFVEAKHRRNGLAATLLMKAANDFYTAGCRSFELPFLDDAARHGRLVTEVRAFAARSLFGAKLKFTFPQAPYAEFVEA